MVNWEAFLRKVSGGAGAVVDVLSWPLHGGTKQNNENLSIACVSAEIRI